MNKIYISKGFLILLVTAILYACYKIFAPFLDEILIAAVLVSIFYVPYEQLVKLLRGRKNIAAFIMCILVTLLVILPLANFIVYAAQRSVSGYSQTLAYINNGNLENIVKSNYFEKVNMLGLSSDTVKNIMIDLAKKTNDWLVSGAASFIRGTTSFFISVILILFTMFFFFVDGDKMVKKIMHWTPLPNKYDKQLFNKFQSVSLSTMVSTFVTAIAQGIVGAIGFIVVGMPAFFPGIAIAFFSLIPYFGAGIVWFPVAIYLLIIGKVWQGVFLLVWGALVVGTIDNLIRAYIIKGKAQVHPIFVVFSILGGISLFGFWGVIFGPLIISLAVTILHIYEMEYGEVLEK